MGERKAASPAGRGWGGGGRQDLPRSLSSVKSGGRSEVGPSFHAGRSAPHRPPEGQDSPGSETEELPVMESRQVPLPAPPVLGSCRCVACHRGGARGEEPRSAPRRQAVSPHQWQEHSRPLLQRGLALCLPMPLALRHGEKGRVRAARAGLVRGAGTQRPQTQGPSSMRRNPPGGTGTRAAVLGNADVAPGVDKSCPV